MHPTTSRSNAAPHGTQRDVRTRRDWATRWKRQNIVPWKCVLCKKENAYGVERCKQCGRLPPAGANLRIQDAAATLVQSIVRRRLARTKLFFQCEAVLRKRFDRRTGNIFVEHVVTGEHYYHILEKLDHELSMDEREELAFEEYQRKEHDSLRLKIAFEERETKRNFEREDRKEKEAQALIDAIAHRWSGPIYTAEYNGELIANWLHFTEISPRVYEIGPRLTLIRLIGNPLVRLPSDIFACLGNLEVLSLSNCGLVELPDEITTLANLRDLNVIRNELEYLPENIGDLSKLEALNITSNKIKQLPESIGNLQAMPRLGLEGNCIPVLPSTIVDLRCKIMSWTGISLTMLPSNIERFGSTLVTLTADHNKIRRIPKGIGALKQLQHLSLCDNLIKYIPDEICQCHNLQRLWLDWNQISQLPPDFLLLEKMQSLHLEGNPMRVPNLEVIIKGVPVIREWFAQNVGVYRDKERQVVIQQIQGLMATLEEENLHDPSQCIAGMTTEAIGEKRDLYFAFSAGYLESVAIPRYNEFIQELSKDSAMLEERKARYQERRELAERQQRLEAELEDATQLQKLNEASTASKENNDTKNNMKTTSANQGGGDAGDAGSSDEESDEEKDGNDSIDDLFAPKEEVAEETIADKKESTSTLRRREEIMQELAVTHTALHGSFGADNTRQRTKEEERVHRTRLALSKLPRFLFPFEFTSADIKDALTNYQDSYGLVFCSDQNAQFRRCACQRNGEPRICVPPNLYFNCERKAQLLKIGLVTYFTKIDRESRNEEEATLEERLAEIDTMSNIYAGSEQGQAFFLELAQSEAANLIEQERQERFITRHQLRIERRRRTRLRKLEIRREALNKSRNSRIEELNKKRFKLTAQLERLRGWEAKEVQKKVQDLDDDIANCPEDMELAILQVQQEDAEERFKMLSHPDNIMHKYRPRGHLHAVLHEAFTSVHAKRAIDLRQNLVHAYELAERRKVSLDTMKEYRIMRRIMFNWMHLGVRMTFETWRVWTRRNVYWRRHHAMEEENQRALDRAALNAEAIFQRAEFEKWNQKVDPFSDLPYWEHCETSEVRWDAPVLEECEYIPRVPRNRA